MLINNLKDIFGMNIYKNHFHTPAFTGRLKKVNYVNILGKQSASLYTNSELICKFVLSFQGIGCYMFRIDDGEVVDATVHGNAARFINHCCEPNCYSRVINVENKKHIIIFALRP